MKYRLVVWFALGLKWLIKPIRGLDRVVSGIVDDL